MTRHANGGRYPGGGPAAGAYPGLDARRAELAANLAAVRERVDAACRDAGRSPAEVRMIAVTKTFPVDDVRLLTGLGVTDIGENRDQEAAAKAAALAADGVEVTWHYIGRLQRNKARSVAGYAGLVHSVDRPELAAALDSAAARRERRLDCLVQVSVDGDTARGGAAEADLDALVDMITDSDALRLRGIMAVAPLDWSPERAFAQVAALSERVRKRAPGAVEISAGMSGDFAEAIRFGATLVRIGSILLGSRRYVG